MSRSSFVGREGTTVPVVQSYRDLRVWQLSMDLAENACRLTRKWPREEAFGLTSQIRRSAASIPANIAEGFGRESGGAFVQFLRIAQGSLKELETHLLLSKRVDLLDEATLAELLSRSSDIGRMLGSLIRKVTLTPKANGLRNSARPTTNDQRPTISAGHDE